MHVTNQEGLRRHQEALRRLAEQTREAFGKAVDEYGAVLELACRPKLEADEADAVASDAAFHLRMFLYWFEHGRLDDGPDGFAWAPESRDAGSTPAGSTTTPGVCSLDDSPATAEHHLLKANGDLWDALDDGQTLVQEDDQAHIQRGAILHALDELGQLADVLGVEGFVHPDDPEGDRQEPPRMPKPNDEPWKFIETMDVEQAKAFDLMVAGGAAALSWRSLADLIGATPGGPEDRAAAAVEKFGFTCFVHGLQLALESSEVGMEVFQVLRMARPELIISNSTPIAGRYRQWLQEAKRS